jgi:hypothetical protein
MSEGISRDLSKKLQQQLAVVLDRELHLFQHVLGAEEIGVVAMEAAVMMVRTAAATIASFATDPADMATLYRATTSGIIDMVGRGEADGIARTQIAAKARRS